MQLRNIMTHDFVQKPCKHCPYRLGNAQALMPEKGRELAILAMSPYETFFCHKTTEADNRGKRVVTDSSKFCAGFLTLQYRETGVSYYAAEGFVNAEGIYNSAEEMAGAYKRENQ